MYLKRENKEPLSLIPRVPHHLTVTSEQQWHLKKKTPSWHSRTYL